MTNRYWDLLFGITLIAGGILIMAAEAPSWNRSNAPDEFAIDLTFVKWVVGPVLVIIGTWIFTLASEQKSYRMIYYKCPLCGEVIEKDDLVKHKCGKCEVYLEELEGFFERYPDFNKPESSISREKNDVTKPPKL